MATAHDKAKTDAETGGNAVKDSAQQIWLAGLGAFAKAQEEGSKVFEALVKEGIGMQRKSQAAAEEKISEATAKMAAMASMASGITAKAAGPWDKLENIFEDRVAKALKKLGVPTSHDIETLISRLDALNTSVQKLAAQTATPPASRKPAATKRSAASEKPAAKKTPARKKGTAPRTSAGD